MVTSILFSIPLLAGLTSCSAVLNWVDHTPPLPEQFAEVVLTVEGMT